MVSSIGSSVGFSSLQQKLFTKLDTNGDGGINKTELSEFMSFAASQSGGTQATDSAALFSSIDSDGDGAISQTELSDGAKSLFDQLRAQLMTSANETSEPKVPPPPPPGEGRGHGGGLFSKIESLLDQYRSTATETDTSSSLSVAA